MSLSSCESCEAFVPLRFSTCPSCGAQQPVVKRVAIRAAMAVAGAGFVTTLMACYGSAYPGGCDAGQDATSSGACGTTSPLTDPGDPPAR